MSASALSGTDRMEISVFGSGDRWSSPPASTIWAGRFGRGARMHERMLGLDPAAGLVL
jgi:hypothetical protein